MVPVIDWCGSFPLVLSLYQVLCGTSIAQGVDLLVPRPSYYRDYLSWSEFFFLRLESAVVYTMFSFVQNTRAKETMRWVVRLSKLTCFGIF